jgi:hypothetical protein
MSTHGAEAFNRLLARIDALLKTQTEARDATFDTAERMYLDMRAKGIVFPEELARALDALFVRGLPPT